MAGPSAAVVERGDGRGGPGGEFGVFLAVEGLPGGDGFWLYRDGWFFRGGGNGLSFRLGLAAFDGVLKGFEGAPVGAFVGVEIALEAGQAFLVFGFGEGGGEAGVARGHFLPGAEAGEFELGDDEELFEGLGFDAAGAVEAPGGFDELVGEQGFFGGDGGEGSVGLAAEFVELCGVFAVEDETGGAESVGEAVLTGGGLAFGGTGPGGLTGVFAIGGGALFGDLAVEQDLELLPGLRLGMGVVGIHEGVP